MRFLFILLLLIQPPCLGTEELIPTKEFSLHDLPTILDALFERHNGKGRIDEKRAIESNAHFFELFDPHKVYLLQREVSPFLQESDGKRFAQRIKNHSFSTYFEMLEICQKAIRRSQNIQREGKEPPHFENYATDDKELHDRLSLLSKDAASHEDLWLSLSPTGETAPKLARFILKSIVATFDAHSKVMDKAQARALRERLTKEGVGTGITAKKTNGSWQIERITKGSPAEKMGIVQVNDTLLSINHIDCSSMSQEGIDSFLHSDEEKSVHITIERNNTSLSTSVPSKPYTISEGRVSVQHRSTPQGSIALITIPSLYRGSNVSTEKDIEEGLIKAKRPLSGMLIDLRDNKGGYISEAARVVGLFVSTGVVASAVYKNKTQHIFRDQDPKRIYTGPIIVLISHTTASSAEIVAQALADYGKAIIVGDPRSYGKGSVQMQTVTRSSSEALPMKMTVGRIHTVSGYCFQGKGVLSDIAISDHAPPPRDKPVQEYDDIEPRFNDLLEDISKEDLSWYKRQYLPYLQAPTEQYRSLLPQLQRERTRRSKRPSSLYFQTEDEDHLLEEAVLILQDLIRLSK